MRRRQRPGVDWAAAIRGARPIPSGRERLGPAADIEGVDLAGLAVRHRLSGPGAPAWTLVLFLSGSCQGCLELWPLLTPGAVAPEVAVVAVARSRAEDPASLRALAPPGGQVVLSDRAFSDFGVQGAPFLVVASGSRPTLVRESVAFGSEQVRAEVAAARAGQEGSGAPFLRAAPGGC